MIIDKLFNLFKRKKESLLFLSMFDAHEALCLYKNAFNAKAKNMAYTEVVEHDKISKILNYAEISVFDKNLFIVDVRSPQLSSYKENFQPEPGGQLGIFFHIYVKNVEKEFQNAIHNGMIVFHPIIDTEAAEKRGIVKDKFGIHWAFCSY